MAKDTNAQALKELRERQAEERQRRNGQESTGRESTLSELEAVVDRGKAAWLEVGTALAEIRDRELYKTRGHGSFWGYCEVRFKISRATGYRLIDAADTVAKLGPVLGTEAEKTPKNLPGTNLSQTETNLGTEAIEDTNLSQMAILELSPLKDDPGAAAAVLAEVGPAPTAKEVREAVRQKKAAFNAEYNIPPVERRTKPAEESQAPVFDEGLAAQVWDKIVAEYGPEPTTEQIRQGMERYRPMTVLESQQRTACEECGDFREVHVTTEDGIGPCTRLRLVDGEDGQTRPERCLCAGYVAPEGDELPASGRDVVVYSTKFVGMVRALHLELNKPEAKMGLAQVAGNATLARQAGEQIDVLAGLLRRAHEWLMEPVEA